MAPKHVAGGLTRDVMAEIGEGAPTAVLLSHADDQRFDLRADWRPSRVRAMLGSVKLAGNQASVPAENRIRLGDTGHLRQEPAAEAFADLSQDAPFGVREPPCSGQVRAQDSILCDQVFALEE